MAQQQFGKSQPHTERQFPQNIEAEQAVLGSIIIDPEAINMVADTLKAEHFYSNAHQHLYTAMLELHTNNDPGDFVTLTDHLKRVHKMDEIRRDDRVGEAYIAWLISSVPTSGNIEYYARIVEQAALRRRLIHAGGQIVAAAYDEQDAALALEQAEHLIYKVNLEQANSDFSSDTEILDEVIDDLMVRPADNVSLMGMPTGYDDLDFCLGGLQRSDLIIIAARPGVGKSSFMLSIAYNAVINDNRCVALFSLEMSKKQLILRLISMHAHVDTHRLRNKQIHDEEWERIMQARKVLATDRLWIDETAGISMTALRSKALRLCSRQKVDCIIVDYLQLMKASGKHDNRVQEIAEITAGLKGLAKELNIPVVALAQLSRAVEGRQVKVPQLSDLRESGSIENDADVVMFIYRDELYNPDSERKGLADIIIAKHRNGPTGEVTLGFQKEETRFNNLNVNAGMRVSEVYEELPPPAEDEYDNDF
jgi:replicative DNA helicase